MSTEQREEYGKERIGNEVLRGGWGRRTKNDREGEHDLKTEEEDMT